MYFLCVHFTNTVYFGLFWVRKGRKEKHLLVALFFPFLHVIVFSLSGWLLQESTRNKKAMREFLGCFCLRTLFLLSRFDRKCALSGLSAHPHNILTLSSKWVSLISHTSYIMSPVEFCAGGASGCYRQIGWWGIHHHALLFIGLNYKTEVHNQWWQEKEEMEKMVKRGRWERENQD